MSSSETLLVDDVGPGLVALVLSDERPFELGDLGDDGGFDPPDVSPLGRGLVLSDEHLFELGELGDDGGSGPPDVSPFGRGRELAIGPLRRQGSKFQFQSLFDAWARGRAAAENEVLEELSTTIDVASPNARVAGPAERDPQRHP